MFAPPIAKPQTKTAASCANNRAHRSSALAKHRLSHGAVDQAHMLQWSTTNQATPRLLSQRASTLTGNESGKHYEQEADPTAMTTREAAPGISWDFSKIP